MKSYWSRVALTDKDCPYKNKKETETYQNTEAGGREAGEVAQWTRLVTVLA